MKRYRVSWIEHHDVIVDAEDSSDAYEKAVEMEPKLTCVLQNESEVECLGCATPDDMDVAHSERECA